MGSRLYSGGVPAAYRLADAPRFASGRTFDCAFCDHAELKRPVFLTGPDGLVAAGTRCAAIALGIVPASTRSESVAAKALRPLQAELDAARRRAAADAERVADAAWQAFLDSAAGPGDRLAQIRSLGGIAAAREAYAAA